MSDNQFELDVMETLGEIRASLPPMVKDIDVLQKEQVAQGKEVAALKVKSGIFGSIGGMISGFIASTLGGG